MRIARHTTRTGHGRSAGTLWPALRHRFGTDSVPQRYPEKMSGAGLGRGGALGWVPARTRGRRQRLSGAPSVLEQGPTVVTPLCHHQIGFGAAPDVLGTCWITAEGSQEVAMPHARPDGSLPPSPRWLRDDPYGQVRLYARIGVAERQQLDGRRQALVDTLDELDAELSGWMAHRREAIAEAVSIHERLWPRLPNRRTGRPPAPDGWPLPPEAADGRPLRGTVLRRWCLAVLRRHGRCSLRELRALLVLYGFTIEADNVPKALSDAPARRARARAGRTSRAWRLRSTGDGAPAAARPHPRRGTERLVPGVDLSQ